jgi:predicted PurR-regulated permease PerM
MLDRKTLEPVIALSALAMLIAGCVMIILPFISAVVWAAIFVFATRHIYWRVNGWLGHRNWLSASIVVLMVFALVVLPLLYAIVNFGSSASEFALHMKDQLQNGVPTLPDWLTHAPWVGAKIQIWWDKLILGDAEVRAQLNNAMVIGLKGLLSFGAMTGQGLGMLVLSCFIALFFYASLPTATLWLQVAMRQVSGSRAEQLLNIAGGTIQGVIFGILGTAVAQGFLTGIGLFIADIPNAAGLAFLAIVLSLMPFGSILIIGPAALWLHHQGNDGWMWFLLIWGSVIVGSADNIVKPLLIGQNSNLPFVLIFLGILGGALQFGALGVFLGPTLLAIGFSLAKEWINGIEQQSPCKS